MREIGNVYNIRVLNDLSSLDWRHLLFFTFFLFLLVGIFQMPVEIAPQFSYKRAHGAGKGLRFRAVDVNFVASQATLLRGLRAKSKD
jgi:hypothetical protein